MTARQRIQLAMSERRERILAIANMQLSDLTPEIKAERDGLIQELQDLEGQVRAAVAGETDEALRGDQGVNDGESAEIRGLLRRASLAGYVGAVLSGQGVDGAEAELQAATGTRDPERGGVVIPWAMLAPRPQMVDAATALPSPSGAAVVQDRVLMRIFAQSVAEFLGVIMTAAEVGQAAIPVITAGTTPGLVAPGATQDATAATITPKVLKPRRLTARYVLRAEDRAQLRGFEEALRQDLTMAMTERLDHFVLNADDGNTGEWSGLFDSLTDATAPTNETDYAAYIGAFASGVDGKHANELGQVRVAVGQATYEALE